MAQNIPIECSGFHAAWLNAVDYMQHGPKHPDWMQWIPCSVIECRRLPALLCNGSRLYSVETTQWGQMHPEWMHWILCSMAQNIPIECSRFHAAWLNAVDFMQHSQIIPIKCSGLHEASLNAEYSIHCGAMDHNCVQWSPCSEAKCISIECSGFYAASLKASRLNAVDSM